MNENMDNPTPTPEEQPQSQDQPQGQTPPPEPEPTPGQVTTPPPPVANETDKDARMWGMFCHLAGLAAFLPFLPFPVGNVIGPLVIWLIKKDEMPFVDGQGKEALNFQISMSIYGLITLPLFCIFVGPFLLAAVIIFSVVMLIIASIAANDGKSYRYPLSIRMIK